MKSVGSVLPITVYPHLEQLLGYDGTHRFVVFSSLPSAAISYHDGTGSGECSLDGWQTFAGHPSIGPLLAMAHLAGTGGEYCLLLDREKRQLFSFQKATAEALLQSDKNRQVANKEKLVEKLEGLFSLKISMALDANSEPAIGTREHFAAWMTANGR